MSDLSGIYARIADEMAEAAELTASALRRAEALAGCRGAVAGGRRGKELRPALLILMAKLFGAPSRRAGIRLAASVELIHAASLIHDDVIDRAAVRRGAPTVSAILGPADAVLLGDTVFTGVFADAVTLGVDGVIETLSRAARDICAGEVRQNRARGTFTCTRNQYLKIIELKTASLYRACGILGVLAGAGSKKHVAAAGRLGRFVGLAFQVADDLLDVIGEAQVTGKPRGADLAEGKVTMPLLVCLDRLMPSARRKTTARLASGDAAFFAEMIASMSRPPVVRAVRRAASDYAAAAAAELRLLPGGPEKKALARLCRFAAERSY